MDLLDDEEIEMTQRDAYTMAMATAIADGARENGADVQLWEVDEADINE